MRESMACLMTTYAHGRSKWVARFIKDIGMAVMLAEMSPDELRNAAEQAAPGYGSEAMKRAVASSREGRQDICRSSIGHHLHRHLNEHLKELLLECNQQQP